tara:strand:+ start:275 stop:991 length:717 start_codon:yes stop_codon:yes gene_type:complete
MKTKFLNNFIPPILLYSNWVDRYFRYKRNNVIKKKITYEKKNYNRAAFIGRALNKFKINPMYLEIGCDQNDVFNSIPLIPSNKIGVDPNSGGTHRMTSDDFFKQNDKSFDVIFIDGLHTFEQTQKDIINSLKILNTNGIIFIHDLLPADEIDADRSRYLPGWSGDVWKVSLELSQSEGLDFKIVNIDTGVGILKKNENYEYKKILEIKNKNFDDFYDKYLDQLPVISSLEAFNFIDTN